MLRVPFRHPFVRVVAPPAEEPVPLIRPFRALRYRPEAVDLAQVVSPPYDVISPADQRTLLERDPRNVVRLDLPGAEPGDEPDDRYRRAARTLAAWRSDGTLHKDPRPSVYAYEQAYRVPGTATDRTQRGFFARVQLEPFGPESGIRPHERTLAAPREDRYRLLRATGVNTSPVIGLYEDRVGESPALLDGIATASPSADVVDDDGVRHRMWQVPDDGTGDGTALALAAAAGRGPITIADGHHRYETALRYRDERRMSRSCEEDPAFDYVLMLLLESSHQPLTVLPTHRVVRAASAARRAADDAAALFTVEKDVPRDRLLREFDGVDGGGRGRFGLWSKGGGAILEARPDAFRSLEPASGAAAATLDVTRLAVALEQLYRLDTQAVTTGGRVEYTKSASEAISMVDAGGDGDVAFLLEPTPVSSIIAVAAEGDVMPQKSTYFYPKPLTGLVINPHEW
jgi:uncharacterized protein (DUF1015 family)